MKAVCWEGRNDVRVEDVPDPTLINPRDAIVRIGGKEEGTLRKHAISDRGVVRDTVYYSILDDEWPAVKTRLESMMARTG